VRVLLKNVGKRMPEAEIREELEALHINVVAVINSGQSDGSRTPRRIVPSHHTSLCRFFEAVMWRTCDL
jgi:hypothetical protein